ncbi:plasmid mobilization relaxosome protein MobC [Snodgrassella communis]|uniref:plasmid mobilization relaxosome protein MobC n=1 Tax=Snodgrassella communis TaxID=2946699 RepID=UPI001EF64406|nr:plasmid mobilization relaxosome protein MobC [Snodgrassella communis]
MSQPKIWGLTEDVKKKLKDVALAKLGKPSISGLAKHLLLKELDNPTPVIHKSDDAGKQRKKYRLELQLNHHQDTYLRTSAEQQSMTANALAVDIINYHITGHPTLSNSEIQALYQSNYQLLRIGRNLNQIARQLNAGESGGITTDEIRQLLTIIDKHTEVVQEVMLASNRRFE